MTTGERDNEGARGIAETAADDAARVGTLDVRRFQLTVVEGPARGLVWRSSAARCSIGAHHRNDVVLDDPTVSRFHCEVVAEAGGLRVLDLESRNGTVLDGVVVRDARARAGSVLRLGKSALQLELGAEMNQVPLSEARSFGSLSGVSPVMRATFALLERAAANAAGAERRAVPVQRLAALAGAEARAAGLGAEAALALLSAAAGVMPRRRETDCSRTASLA